MYRSNPFAEQRFDVRMRASRAQGGQERYERIERIKVGNDYDDPLDAAFDPDRKVKRRAKRKGDDLTGEQFRTARAQLGHMWGLGRPLTLTEFGRVLRLGGVRPDQSVRDYERGKTQVSGPMSLLIELLLAGARPANLSEILT
jgi:hypothetical protein